MRETKPKCHKNIKYGIVILRRHIRILSIYKRTIMARDR